MNKSLNSPAINEAMRRLGLYPAEVARQVGVSRPAVTKWFSGKDFPRADKLLKLGLLLRLSFRELVVEEQDGLAPVVAFRRKARRKTTGVDLDAARRMGNLLRTLAPRLPFDKFSRPPTLKNPVCDYGYLQQVSLNLRADVGVPPDTPLQLTSFVHHFKALQAVLIPVPWGHKDRHENAVHIYLPDSMTTWIYLNVDSNMLDFNFWMAHELAHAYAPDLRDDPGEDFADAFAQALLFPEVSAEDAYGEIMRGRSVGGRINRIKEFAKGYAISPTTVAMAVDDYARAHDLEPLGVGSAIHAASTNFCKKYPSIAQMIFGPIAPTPTDLIWATRDIFQSPFFDALQQHVREAGVNAAFIQNILNLPLADARGLLAELVNGWILPQRQEIG